MTVSKLSLIFLFLAWQLSFAQIETPGPNPPSIKWQKINTDNSQIIFPKGTEKQAFRVATIVDFLAEKNAQSIGGKVDKVPIILHTKSMEPNGFVAPVPFRSEFFPVSIPNWNITGQTPWLDLLAIHEYRHVLQFSNVNHGLSHLVRIVTGRLGLSTVSILTDPAWFAEGDAVVSETVQTAAGRGRLPSFSEEQRALFYANKKYPYMKARNGSYKTLLPSHYPLGYVMNLYAREKYGNDIWGKILHDANNYRSILYPFSGAIKRNTGLSARKLYKESYADLKTRSAVIFSETDVYSSNTIVQPEKRKVFNYSYPYQHATGDIITRKSGFNLTPEIVKIDEAGKEKILTHQGFTSNAFLSYSPKGILWVEDRDHPRWENVDTRRLVYYDFETDKKEYINTQQKTYFAAISPLSDKYFSIETDENYQFHLIEYAKNDHKKIKELTPLAEAELGYPMYDRKGTKLYYIVKKDGKMAIVAHDIDRDNYVYLTEWLNHTMTQLAQNENYLFFRASFSGIDNVFAISKSANKQIYQCTSVPVAAGNPATSTDGQSLLFTNTTNTGSYLSKAELVLKPFNVPDIQEMEQFESVNSLSENRDILNVLPDRNFEIKPYKSFFRGIRFHSWGVLPSLSTTNKEGARELNLNSAYVFVNAEDILSSQNLNLNYTRYVTEGENGYGADYAMGKYFVTLHAGYQYRGRSVQAPRGDRILNYKESDAYVGLGLPLNWTYGNFRYATNFKMLYRQIQPFSSENISSFDFTKFGVLEGLSQIEIQRQQAYQHVQSRLGVNFSGKISRSLSTNRASLGRISGGVLLPGIGKNHGITINTVFQKEALTNTYQFPEELLFAKGFPIAGLEKGQGISFQYQLPLLYPDLGIPGITFLKRIRGTMFYDMANIANNEIKTNISSFGMELRFDQAAFNTFEIPIGIRIGYRRPNQYLQFEQPIFINFILAN